MPKGAHSYQGAPKKAPKGGKKKGGKKK
jgi:hypothetical protein